MAEQQKSFMDRWARLPWLVRVGVVIGVGLVVITVYGNVRAASNAADNDRAPLARSTTAASAPPSAAFPAGQIGPGVWLVGSDIEPGTYRSSGPSESGEYCMWSRHDSASGGPLDGILASDGSFDAAQLIATIEPGDVLFRTDGCAPWALLP